MTDHDTYVIRATRQGWALLLNGAVIRTFADRGEAERAAMAGMDVSRQSSKSAELYRQDEDGVASLVTKTVSCMSGEVALGPDPANAR